MTQVPLLSVNGFTIADLALLSPGPGQFLEVGGATEGRIDIEALAAYCKNGTIPTAAAGLTGLAVLATATQAAARAAIGANAVEVITNANGTAIRLPEMGIQICFFDPPTSTTTPSAWGNVFVSSFVSRAFPAAFNTIPTVTLAVRHILGQGAECWGLMGDVTSGFARMYAVAAFSNGSCRLGYVAIGTYTP